jgi:DNA-binding response OmpR family regulator
VAEDDAKQSSLIRLYLERDGHAVEVVADGRAAVDQARRWRPDVLVLDVMMPLLDGFEVCRILREESGLGILLLTARSAEEDLLCGLDLGADDYLTKPYSPRELTARVRALLRRGRSPRTEPTAVLRVGVLEVDVARFEVRVAGTPVLLTAKEFDILEVLARQPGKVLTRTAILSQSCNLDHDVLARSVDVHVMNLRRKLEERPDWPRMLETVYGRGYRLAVR